MFEEMEASGSNIPMMAKALKDAGWIAYGHHDNWIKKEWSGIPDVRNISLSLNEAYEAISKDAKS